MSQGEAAWSGNARETVKLGYIGTDSAMLSVFISAMGSTDNKLDRFRWGFCAELRAWSLRGRRKNLTYKQLNVLAKWLIRTSALIPTRKKVAIKFALDGVRALVDNDEVSPVEQALAWMTLAQAYALGQIDRLDCIDLQSYMRDALAARDEILATQGKERLQALRQQVRLYKDAAKIEISLSYLSKSYDSVLGNREHLLRAHKWLITGLALAKHEANTESQAKQILELLASPRIHLQHHY